MNLVNATALVVSVVLLVATYALGIAYKLEPSRVTLHSNAIALHVCAALAAIAFAATLPDTGWYWRLLVITAAIIGTYAAVRLLNRTRTEYEASQQRNFVQATTDDDRTNR